LGQTQPVKAVFAIYKDAMEAQALALMGRKMRAAQLLYGDTVGGGYYTTTFCDGHVQTRWAKDKNDIMKNNYIGRDGIPLH
jgi:prepilin-type processing-associated H-X9-DG protein